MNLYLPDEHLNEPQRRSIDWPRRIGNDPELARKSKSMAANNKTTGAQKSLLLIVVTYCTGEMF